MWRMPISSSARIVSSVWSLVLLMTRTSLPGGKRKSLSMFRGSWRQNRALMMGIPSERARAYLHRLLRQPDDDPGLRAQYSFEKRGLVHISQNRLPRACPRKQIWCGTANAGTFVPSPSHIEAAWNFLGILFSILFSFLSKGVINPH